MEYNIITADVDNSFPILCRTCFDPKGEISIFAQCENIFKTYAEMLMEVASIKVTTEDDFPSQICKACMLELQQSYGFQKRCIQVNEWLIQNYSQRHQIKVESVKDELQRQNQIKVENLKDDFPTSDREDNDEFSPFDDKTELSDTDCNTGTTIFKNTKVGSDERLTTSDEAIINKSELKTELENESDIKLKRNQQQEQTEKTAKHACTVCSRSFVSNYKLKFHMLVHTKEKPFICDICGNKFTSNGNLKRHMKAHLGERDFVCEYEGCGKRFCQKVTLIEHERIHTGEKPFRCELCDKAFKTSSCLRQHRLGVAHGNSRPVRAKPEGLPTERHECTECGKSYATKNGLYQHAIRHTDKKLTCPVCDKQFISYAGLQQHKSAQHSADHKYQCNLCGKVFKYQVVFKTHMLIHTGVKPFKCQYCTKQFTQRGHVISHERLHTGDKPYECDFCHKVFRHLTTLRDHRRTHTGEVPYNCHICSRGFYNSTSLKKHQINHHRHNYITDH